MPVPNPIRNLNGRTFRVFELDDVHDDIQCCFCGKAGQHVKFLAQKPKGVPPGVGPDYAPLCEPCCVDLVHHMGRRLGREGET